MKRGQILTQVVRGSWIFLLFALLIVPALASVIGRDRYQYRSIGSNEQAWTFINLHKGIITICYSSDGEPPSAGNKSSRAYLAARDLFVSSEAVFTDTQRELARIIQAKEKVIENMERQGSDFLDIAYERQDCDRLRASQSRLSQRRMDARERLSKAVVRELQNRSFAGFYAAYGDTLQNELSVSFPAWLPCVPAFLLLARMGLRRRRARKRLRAGLCIHCAYDLRGSVSRVCSECGAAIPDDSAVAANGLATPMNVLKT